MEASNLKLLAIDDNPDNLITLKALLADSLHAVKIITARDGREGLEKARAEEPDVILLDLVMPGMDGYAVCRELKEDDRLRFTPVLIMTALKTDRSSRIKALESGAEAFLSKPIDEVELVTQIRSMVKIKAAYDRQHREKERLTDLVVERTRELEKELAERRQAEQDLKQEIDIRQKAEAELRESEEKFRTITEQMHELVFLTDIQGIIHYVSPAAEAIFGFRPEEMQGQPFAVFLDPSCVERARAAFCRALSSGISSRDFELLMKRKDGSVFTGELSGTVYRKGAIAGTMGLIRDISDRKRAEEERKAIEAQLRQAQKMEAIGTLAGGVAHDFNNMLGAILGSVDLALMDVVPSTPLHGNLLQIRQAARRSADLTRQILAFARKQSTSPQRLNVNREIDKILGMLKPLIGEDICLIWEPEDRLGSVWMDPAQVDQILTNLIVNARDAIPGAGTITVETANRRLDEDFCRFHEGLEPGDYVSISISDTGVGIPADILPKIFDPFFTTKGLGRGTGLGLSTVFGIVKQNGGVVTVSSHPGMGTLFHLFLPRIRGEATSDQLPEGGAGRWGTETLLLVEDEEQILDTGKIILERHGYTVLTARHPEEGLQVFVSREADIALLITDVIMPGLNGRELYERLADRRPDLKCLFISAYPAEVITARGLLGPDIHFIQKPFSLVEFTEKVREVLDGGGEGG